MKVKNPFKFDKEVNGDFFCGRENDITNIIDYIENETNIIMFSKRRIGKTSVIKEIFSKRLDKSILSVHIDIYSISTIKEFYEYLKTGIEESFVAKESTLEKIAKMADEIRECFVNAEIKLVVGTRPSIEITSTQKDYFKAIEDLIKGFYHFLVKNEIQGVIAIDEFQKIVSLAQAEKLEALLRTLTNKRENCSFIFTGSQRNLLLSMFDRADRPFFKLGANYHLESINKEVFFKWTAQRFQRKEIILDKSGFDFLYEEADGETRFIQMISYELFKEFDSVSVITLKDVQNKIKSVLKSRSELGQILDSYSTPHQNTLKILAASDGVNIYEAELLEIFEIKKGTLQSSVKSLLMKGMIFLNNGRYEFEDLEFKLWLKNK